MNPRKVASSSHRGGPLREVSPEAAQRVRAMIEAGTLTLSDARMMLAAADKAAPLTVGEACSALPGAEDVPLAEALRLADVTAARQLRSAEAAAVEDLDWLASRESPLTAGQRRWPWHPATS